MTKDNPVNIENKIMADIKSGRVKLRSKYIFIAEKLGLGSAFALSILLAILFFSLILFYLKASDNLFYLSFGSRGLFAFLESFPFLLVASVIILIFIAGFIIKKSGAFYHKPFGRLALGLISLVISLGFILTFTNLAEMIERETFRPRPTGMFFRPFLQRGFENRRSGIAGRAISINDKIIDIQTPRTLEKIDISHIDTSTIITLIPGKFITAIGERQGDVFIAKDIRIVNEEDILMIRHGVHEKFGQFNFKTTTPPPGGDPTHCFEGQCPRQKI